MVLFGDHAADPHGEPGDRTLKENEWVLFDLGTMVDGYASDITRTVFFEIASEKSTPSRNLRHCPKARYSYPSCKTRHEAKRN